MRYSIGLDFGTEAARLVCLDMKTGLEVSCIEEKYPHGVIGEYLCEGEIPLPSLWALQHPDDYVHVLMKGIPKLLTASQVNPEHVMSIGVDFTSSTVIPTLADGTPLCKVEPWDRRPHAWPKLWKHHAAQDIANRFNVILRDLDTRTLSRYGDNISAEWYFPKLIEIFEEDRDVYDACDFLVEATDWIVWILTGSLKRSSCAAGYKAFWSPDTGFPDKDVFRRVSPKFLMPFEKIGKQFYPPGTCVGRVRSSLASQLGLSPNTVVSVGTIDAHAAFLGSGITKPGTMMMVIGTSTCHLTLSERDITVPGISGVLRDGIVPGYYAYEAGQSAVGDMFSWFINEFLDAKDEGTSDRAYKFEYLNNLAKDITPGGNGLIALDWWNGNRSILGDLDLSGAIFGLRLDTKLEQIYRSLLEATAFGAKRILDNFIVNGITVTKLVASGGIARKNSLLMQIYADVCQVPIYVPNVEEVSARGAALLGAIAAGYGSSVELLAERLKPEGYKIYVPNPRLSSLYYKLYDIYSTLHDVLGIQHSGTLHSLKRNELD
ncbi:ribulokinase [Alicyclobacillus hesperidum subsp. aegles]|uniref:ribulokinase n=1 Tax=Alicyclobacillus hesperidum TaxID=89784 RepID=UPI00222B4B70|nr:ribulokinase [Alicyclobacillus hesperidum]GLG02815.1 ribulokinase [Alicyclobacillus hesperidum subsp. aegles]